MIIAGGIVRNRDWIIERSVSAIRQQTRLPNEIYYLTNDNEDNTERVLLDLNVSFDVCSTGCPGWARNGVIRYSSANMGYLRNEWLKRHRDQASHYWIVDSDIIVNPDVLEKLLALDKPCAGAFIPGCPPMASWDLVANQPRRTNKEKEFKKPFKATCMGGCYLLRRDFLDGVSWEPWGAHPQGEDGYLATLAREGNWEIWIDPTATGLHVMEKDR